MVTAIECRHRLRGILKKNLVLHNEELSLEGTMASAEREPITGVSGRSPQRGPGAEPLIRGSGRRSP